MKTISINERYGKIKSEVEWNLGDILMLPRTSHWNPQRAAMSVLLPGDYDSWEKRRDDGTQWYCACPSSLSAFWSADRTQWSDDNQVLLSLVHRQLSLYRHLRLYRGVLANLRTFYLAPSVGLVRVTVLPTQQCLSAAPDSWPQSNSPTDRSCFLLCFLQE